MMRRTLLPGLMTRILIGAGYLIGGTMYAFMALGIACVMNLYET